jgi:D-alanyl-D-alanine carboxypeptidase
MRNVPRRVEVNVAAMPMPPSRPSLVAMALPPQPKPAQSNPPRPAPVPLAVASATPPSLAPGAHESEELTSMTALVVASVTPTSPPSEPVSLEGAASVFEGAGSIADDTRRELAERLQSERWLIQIGAYNNETAARQRLAAALQSANTHLAPRLAYTEPVETSSRTLFRARFAGFDQASAQAACTQLKRADFTCISMKQ